MWQFTLTELDRRISNLIQLGHIHKVDGTKASVKIGEIITDTLPWVVTRAGVTWWVPEVGEQVVVLAPSGELNQGVILAGLYSQNHPAPSDDPNEQVIQYPDGTKLTYNNHNLTIDANPQGSIDLRVGASSIRITNQNIIFSGNVVGIK